MTYALVLFALVLLIGPIMHVLPSKRERTVAAMRSRGIKSGFKIKFVDFDEFKEALAIDEDYSLPLDKKDQIVRYSKYFDLENPKDPWKAVYSVDKNQLDSTANEATRWLEKLHELEDLMLGLLAVNFDGESLHLYWLERGDISTFSFENGPLNEITKICS